MSVAVGAAGLGTIQATAAARFGKVAGWTRTAPPQMHWQHLPELCRGFVGCPWPCEFEFGSTGMWQQQQTLFAAPCLPAPNDPHLHNSGQTEIVAANQIESVCRSIMASVPANRPISYNRPFATAISTSSTASLPASADSQSASYLIATVPG